MTPAETYAAALRAALALIRAGFAAEAATIIEAALRDQPPEPPEPREWR